MSAVQVERRRRGPFGWIVAILFWGWQLLMTAALIVGLNAAGQVTASYHTQVEQTGAAIGAGLSVTALLVLWVLGTIILGFMMMFTRGRREFVTVERHVVVR